MQAQGLLVASLVAWRAAAQLATRLRAHRAALARREALGEVRLLALALALWRWEASSSSRVASGGAPKTQEDLAATVGGCPVVAGPLRCAGPALAEGADVQDDGICSPPQVILPSSAADARAGVTIPVGAAATVALETSETAAARCPGSQASRRPLRILSCHTVKDLSAVVNLGGSTSSRRLPSPAKRTTPPGAQPGAPPASDICRGTREASRLVEGGGGPVPVLSGRRMASPGGRPRSPSPCVAVGLEAAEGAEDAPRRSWRGPERFFYDTTGYTGCARYGGPKVVDKKENVPSMRGARGGSTVASSLAARGGGKTSAPFALDPSEVSLVVERLAPAASAAQAAGAGGAGGPQLVLPR